MTNVGRVLLVDLSPANLTSVNNNNRKPNTYKLSHTDTLTFPG